MQTDAIEIIYKSAQKAPDINEAAILAEVANYTAKEGPFKKPFLWNTDTITAISPTAWWKGFFSNTELSRMASRFLELPATSAACERSFSSYSRIHSKSRNRLTNIRASKIVYLAHNLKLIAELEHDAKETPTSSSEPVPGPSSEVTPYCETKIPSDDEEEDSESLMNIDTDSDAGTDIDSDTTSADSHMSLT